MGCCSVLLDTGGLEELWGEGSNPSKFGQSQVWSEEEEEEKKNEKKINNLHRCSSPILTVVTDALVEKHALAISLGIKGVLCFVFKNR